MPREFSRTQRLGEQIRRDLSQLIRDEVRDPRIGMITISEVEVSRDLGHAKVFVTVLLDEHKQQSVDILNRASGFLRKELGRRLSTRITPQLHFYIDETIEKGAHISSLIDAAIAADQEKSEAAPDDDDDHDA